MKNIFYFIFLQIESTFSIASDITNIFGCEGSPTQDICLSQYYCGWCSLNNTNSCYTLNSCNKTLKQFDSCIYHHNEKTCNLHKILVFTFLTLCLISVISITTAFLKNKIKLKFNNSIVINLLVIPGLIFRQ